MALSCQRRSSRWETSDSAKKMTTPGDREQQQRREHARDVEAIAGLGDAVGEPGAGAGRAGRDLCDDRADQRQPARDLQAAEDVGQRRRQLELAQHLPARGAVEPEQVGEIVIDRVEAERGVGEHGKEGDDPGAGEHRRLLRQIDEQQRRDRHDRRHLQDHRIGIERILDQARLIEQDRKGDPADHRKRKAFSVVVSVTTSDADSTPQSDTSVEKMSHGPGST